MPSWRGTGSTNSWAFKFADIANSGDMESEVHPESNRTKASKLWSFITAMKHLFSLSVRGGRAIFLDDFLKVGGALDLGLAGLSVMTPRRSGGEKAFTRAGSPSKVLPLSSFESDTACKGGQFLYGLSLMAFRRASRGSVLSSADSTSEPLRASPSESDTSHSEGQLSDR